MKHYTVLRLKIGSRQNVVSRVQHPAAIDPLDSDIEGKIVSGLTRELNDCYCLNLPVNPNLQRGSASPLLELGKGKLVLVGASHTDRMSALIPASLETQFLKLPGQSQTNDGVGDILAATEQGNLKKRLFVYGSPVKRLFHGHK